MDEEKGEALDTMRKRNSAGLDTFLQMATGAEGADVDAAVKRNETKPKADVTPQDPDENELYSLDDGKNTNVLPKPRPQSNPDATPDENVDAGRRGSAPSQSVPVDGLPQVIARRQTSDNFSLQYEQVATHQIPVGLTRVTTPEEVAHVVAPFRKHAQETLLAFKN